MTADELAKIARKWHAARDRERALADELYAAIAAACKSGISEVEVAEIAGVNRMTVRRALGKL